MLGLVDAGDTASWSGLRVLSWEAAMGWQAWGETGFEPAVWRDALTGPIRQAWRTAQGTT